MKINRWKIIKSLKSRLLPGLLLSSLGYLPLIVVGICFICQVIQWAIQGRNIYRILDLGDNWWIYALLGVLWLLEIYAYFVLVEWGLLFDILFIPVERLSDVLGSTITYPTKTNTFDRNYASTYWIEIRRGKKYKPLPLFVSKEFGTIPKGAKYDILYLKHSKLIVEVDVLEGGREKTPREIPIMDPPIIPRYSKEELIAMTKTHRLPSLGLLIYCIAGFGALVIWGIYSLQNFFYWYRLEIGRCIGIWIFLISLEILFCILFRKMDRGYLWDIHCREICVTEVIPIETIYGKKFWVCVDRKMRDRINGIELEVTEGTHKNERFLVYREISKYWNCFPMCASLHPRFRGRPFEPGEQKLKAVRIYYLKHSKIIIDMDVVEAKT